YAAGEFRRPARDVPRAMMLAVALVTVGYLLVNWVFVANLSGARLTGFADGDTSRVTLGHLITRDLLGPAGAAAMSVLVLAAASALYVAASGWILFFAMRGSPWTVAWVAGLALLALALWALSRPRATKNSSDDAGVGAGACTSLDKDAASRK